MAEMLNITFNASKINIGYPYNITTIINNTSHGDIASVVTFTNSEMGYLPFRILLYSLFFAFIGLGRLYRQDISFTRLFAVSGIITAIVGGVGYLFGMLGNPLELSLFIVVAGMSGWLSKGDTNQ